jgi:hypothetical protein
VSAVDVFDLDVDDEREMRLHALAVASDGRDKSECPVAPSHPQWSAWQLAWGSHRSLMERGSGAMRTRTNLMKAEVRRQMEHLHEYQPDPCAEVAEPRRRSNHHADHLHVNITATVSAFEEALKRAAVVVADASPDMQQLRHGSAATCPRHGRTKGGTCMKCARRR